MVAGPRSPKSHETTLTSTWPDMVIPVQRFRILDLQDGLDGRWRQGFKQQTDHAAVKLSPCVTMPAQDAKKASASADRHMQSLNNAAYSAHVEYWN